MTREEAQLWQRAMRGATPLAMSESVPPTPVKPADSVSAAAVQRAAAPPPPAVRREPMPALEHGTAAGLDRRTADRLRRGILPVEGTIDLHGLTQEQAHAALDRYIESAWNSGRRCIVVVTGKGLWRDRTVVGDEGQPGAGVLRQAVPRWLNEVPNRERILAFCHAQPKHGGSGALYVLLRRRR